MTLPDKVARRKTPPSVEDDPMVLLADAKLGLFFLVEPLSALKTSRVDTTEGGGESSPSFSLNSSDTPSHPSPSWFPQLFSRTVTMEPHLLPTVKALTDLIPREHLQEVGLYCADTMGILYSLLRSLSRVCDSHTVDIYMFPFFAYLTVFMLQATYEVCSGIAVAESHRRDQSSRISFLEKHYSKLRRKLSKANGKL